MRTLRTTVALLLTGVALSACAEAGTQPGSTPTPVPTSTITPGGVVSPSPEESLPIRPTRLPKLPQTPALPPGPKDNLPTSAETTLTGTVTTGVEAGCVLLDDYLLVGGPRDVLTPGARVTVTGHVQRDLLTTCQQGIPFVVATAKRA